MKKAAPFLLLILLFIVAGWYFFTQEPEPVHEMPEASAPTVMPAAQDPVEPEPELSTAPIETLPEPEPEVIEEPLPPLTESDTAIKPALGEIVNPGLLDQYLIKDQVISRLVATVNALDARQVPPPINPVKSVETPFAVETEGDRVVLSEDNFARYDKHVALLDSMNVDTLVLVYERYAPLFQQAWEENGHDGPFDQRAIEVIDHLLATPDVPGPIYLVKPEAFYLYEDPALESMTAGQKILIRMGSMNAEVVKAKLRELRNVLAVDSM